MGVVTALTGHPGRVVAFTAVGGAAGIRRTGGTADDRRVGAPICWQRICGSSPKPHPKGCPIRAVSRSIPASIASRRVSSSISVATAVGITHTQRPEPASLAASPADGAASNTVASCQ